MTCRCTKATRISSLCALALLCAAQVGSAQQQWPGYGSYYQQQPYPQPNVQQPYAQPNVQQPYAQQPYVQPNVQRVYYQTPYYGYYQANQQPIQRVQATYPSYGYYPNSAYPPSSYYYPRMNSNMYVPGVPAGGWNFNYTPPNPILPSQSAYNVPIYAAPYRAVSGVKTPAPTSWPAPTATSYPLPTEDPSFDTKKPPVVIPFHRPTKDTFWVRADYTMGFLRPMRVTPLVTTGNPLDDHPGALGQPGTSVLYGGNSIDFGMFSGVRLETGFFLDCANRFSVDIGGFWLLPGTQSFYQASDATGSPLLARPIFRTSNDDVFREAAFAFTAPGSFVGSVAVNSKSSLGGVELNGRYHSYAFERLHTDFLGGFRYMRLSEQIQLQDSFTPIEFDPGQTLTFRAVDLKPGESLRDTDLFQTSNQFFGPQIGARASWEAPWYTVDGFAKLGVGLTEQRVKIDGSTTLFSPAGNQTAAGGTLAQPSNIGTYSRTVLGIVPEFGFNFGVNVTEHIRLKFGYSLLLWNQVVRPGGEIDRNVNINQPPHSFLFGQVTGPANPAFRFNDEFFWSQFFNFGIEAHF